ncbi:hypothetical protein DFR33_101445 [Bradymonas sediminis]|nr:hypothetical protein DFR33_101445 [Bradymonas sediminis]
MFNKSAGDLFPWIETLANTGALEVGGARSGEGADTSIADIVDAIFDALERATALDHRDGFVDEVLLFGL